MRSIFPWSDLGIPSKIWLRRMVHEYQLILLVQDSEDLAGDLLYLQVPTQNFVVLSSAQAAFDLLEKRSDIYSDRPTFLMHKL